MKLLALSLLLAACSAVPLGECVPPAPDMALGGFPCSNGYQATCEWAGNGKLQGAVGCEVNNLDCVETCAP